jgi:hypothetical protein
MHEFKRQYGSFLAWYSYLQKYVKSRDRKVFSNTKTKPNNENNSTDVNVVIDQYSRPARTKLAAALG